MIKVTLGLVSSPSSFQCALPLISGTLSQRKSVFQSQGIVATKSDGVEDLQAGYMWGSHGFPDASDEDMHL